MNIGEAYDNMVQITATAPSVTAGMNTLLDYCTQVYPHPVWEGLRHLDYDTDVAALREWLENLLTQEPPAPNIIAFWFGHYESENDGPTYILYLSGSVDNNPNSSEWACWKDDSYVPGARYADSRILETIFRAVKSEPDAVLLAEYMLCLGYACLAVPLLFQSLPLHLVLGEAEQRMVATGFDEGDWVVLGQVSNQGWMPAPKTE